MIIDNHLQIDKILYNIIKRCTASVTQILSRLQSGNLEIVNPKYNVYIIIWIVLYMRVYKDSD